MRGDRPHGGSERQAPASTPAHVVLRPLFSPAHAASRLLPAASSSRDAHALPMPFRIGRDSPPEISRYRDASRSSRAGTMPYYVQQFEPNASSSKPVYGRFSGRTETRYKPKDMCATVGSSSCAITNGIRHVVVAANGTTRYCVRTGGSTSAVRTGTS